MPVEVVAERAAERLPEAIESIFAKFAPRSFNGMKVLVKPNIVGPSPGDSGIVTHPEVVRAVVEACFDRGAKVFVGDNPGGINRSTQHTGKVTGILDASLGCFVPIADRVVEVPARSEFADTFVVSRLVLEADYVINLPLFKTHMMMGLTGALKNTFGYIAGACKAQLHLKAPSRRDFAAVLADVHSVRPPNLHIMDALTVMEGNGPSVGGHVRPYGWILGATDALALDTTMARLMAFDPLQVPLFVVAKERGMGAFDAEDIALIGSPPAISDFRPPTTYQAVSRDEKIAVSQQIYPGDMMSVRVVTKPQLQQEKCLACGDCETNCPPQALHLDPFPTVDDNCIACYCCVELCSEGALEVPDIEAFQRY